MCGVLYPCLLEGGKMKLFKRYGEFKTELRRVQQASKLPTLRDLQWLYVFLRKHGATTFIQKDGEWVVKK